MGRRSSCRSASLRARRRVLTSRRLEVLLVWCGVLCCAVLCRAVLCCAVLCCAVLCCAALSVLCSSNVVCRAVLRRVAPCVWHCVRRWCWRVELETSESLESVPLALES